MKRKYWVLGIGSAIVVLIIGLLAAWQNDRQHYASLIDRAADVKKWEADPRPLQSAKQAEAQIAALKQDGTTARELLKAYELVVIPGLRGAWSIDPKTGKAAFGHDWVPQGVAQSKTHLYISMYDGDHRLNSIITQIDAKTGKYLKTLILNSKAHVGGIAYDNDHELLMWSDDNGKYDGAGFSYVSQSGIDTYFPNKFKAPLPTSRIPWQLGQRTSALTVYGEQLVIAKYGKTANHRSIVAVSRAASGIPQAITMDQIKAATANIPRDTSEEFFFKAAMKALMKDKVIDSYAPGWDRLQGIAIAQNGLTLLSQSNGLAPGKVWVKVPSDKSWSKLNFSAPEAGAKVLTVPHSVEEVSLNATDDRLAMIFESGAQKYRQTRTFLNRPSFMDRLMIIKIKI